MSTPQSPITAIHNNHNNHNSSRRWTDLPEQLEQRHFGIMLAVGGALALLLLVSFIGVLQGQVQRSDMRRAQQQMAASPTNAGPQPVVIVAGFGR